MKSRILSGMFAILALPFSLRASLGGDATSVQADREKMQGTLKSTSGDTFTLHEIQASTGVAVKEYVSPAGKVFAVSWQGPTHPDLRQLLGAYFEQYMQAVQAERARRRGHGPLRIEQAGLVVELGGHMRSYRGRVYVPQMLPAGVRAEDIR